MIKNLPANAGDTGGVDSIPGQEDPLEKEMTTHSYILVWRIPLTEEPGKLQSMGCKESELSEYHFHFSYHFSKFHMYVLICDI